MKAIIQYKSRMLGLIKSIDKIYFDTLGYYPNLRASAEEVPKF